MLANVAEKPATAENPLREVSSHGKIRLKALPESSQKCPQRKIRKGRGEKPFAAFAESFAHFAVKCSYQKLS